ncbi:MAG: DNA polymerase III, subunit gamma and tau [Candidatus Ryanbacteria bacterium RIFCSPHIGHO2_02_FULL_45_43]|uniref:DNA polymerase III subunit gamma/tau n=1 Tax=Candidatus Ryanbacteria bacterium RIFCSPHIGHO2_01_45_13 TaxID=1802112 RepID=A0A1G2G0N3_9BACT|nr:MAG: DNA polymerase III, subunit gamma and tau [Candidatus Ryanbacteria bacterium RIFCSPHIGHO2_01_FULL_44_130]OGZ43552.1 MAG: DNA polymerase III, subunit gamma and tau [Candidatus Ryanbacteria bacterium RIFCSPHIGHO2_01_45_13]OGZ47928.1 MAG: DNA polymerase III, subunit gamma and tau [Candidatus Ryanbacteria bacterium RIFCSPHIGHO2_02_FULL_45_43]OGZ49942.1 MAG: DNA polymerase III, subunit gamma and tau [Candidatus Ryanbacteria bacterium RIFCSPHIGHO2_12_FULL_44_20]OGZ51051.1 MAG: DNA polymerase 
MEDHQLVLYRKYRPKSFREVKGQDHIVRALISALEAGRVSHGYLFSGPRGTGKTTVARLLAKAVNCEQKGSGEPCNACGICEEFLRGSALDLIEIDAASNRGIDEIRELREAVRFAPHRAKRKVYIIDEVHMLTREAFNALLKTLEEPPKHVMFILATTDPEKVPDTIRSRTQHFEFHRLPVSVIQERLEELAQKENIKHEKEVPHVIALLSEGSLRDAESMFGQLLGIADKEIITSEDVSILFGLPKAGLVAKFSSALLHGDIKTAFAVIEQSLEQGVDPKMFNKMAIEDLRTALLLAINMAYENELKGTFSDERIAFLKNLAKKAGVKKIELALVPLLEAYHSPHTTVLPQIPLELAVLRITQTDQNQLIS